MHQLIFGIMLSNNIHLKELEEQRVIKIDDKTSIPYDFYKSLENHHDNWTVPTETLYGERDNIIHIENIADFLTNHPNARLTIKQGAEHYMHTDEEKEFIKNWILSSLG